MSDSELAVLGLLIELGPISGYRMTAAVSARGMSAWAGLSATSVYSSLRRLRKARLARAVKDANKRGRGPVGLLFSATPTGRATARRQLATALVEGREHSATFRLALAFSGMLGLPVASLLQQRAKRLRVRIEAIESARGLQRRAGGEAVGAALVFDYVVAGLEHEVVMTERLRKLLEVASD